jgi:hypothetical protein
LDGIAGYPANRNQENQGGASKLPSLGCWLRAIRWLHAMPRNKPLPNNEPGFAIQDIVVLHCSKVRENSPC